VKSGGTLWSCARAARVASTAFLFAVVIGGLGTPVGSEMCFAQASSVADASDSIHGIVINGVTREPIGRALVLSPDNRFAALTNSEGRFEFTLSKAGAADQSGSDSGGTGSSGPTGVPARLSNRPYMLTVRKPGFMPDPNNPGQNLQNDPTSELTLDARTGYRQEIPSRIRKVSFASRILPQALISYLLASYWTKIHWLSIHLLSILRLSSRVGRCLGIRRSTTKMPRTLGQRPRFSWLRDKRRWSIFRWSSSLTIASNCL